MDQSSLLTVRFDDYSVEFDPSAGGFPSRMALRGREGETVVASTLKPWLEVDLGGGVTVAPFWPEGLAPAVTQHDSATRVDFPSLPFRDASGRVVEDFQLSLRYEFWPEGTGFARAFFFVARTEPPEMRGFRLSPPVNLPAGADAAWTYWERPSNTNADLIQALGGIKRFQKPGQEVKTEGALLPFVGFDFGAGELLDKHLEYFLEGANSLTSDWKNTATSITWSGGQPKVEWNFVREPRQQHRRGWQWRNQFGWTLCQTPEKRRLPPPRFYHCFDSIDRYPTDAQVDKMAAEGADLLVMHENWRRDVQNGCTPHDAAAFQRMVDRARSHGMRVAVYIRGNEISCREDHCDWFDNLFRRDHDGLYMDYGSPVCFFSGLEETYPGGRIGFREFFLMMRALRKRVGEKGVFLAHAGPFFTACGMAGIVDGYVAGEGERGVLLSGRRPHAYFSGLSVAPPTLWTAAFPDYRTPRAVPFLAAVGQAPHVTLGTQVRSSSLDHPKEPGVTTFARPLWRVWGLLKGEHGLSVWTDQNTQGLFAKDADTGACLFQTASGAQLLVATNFLPNARTVSLRVAWGQSGLGHHGAKAVFLDPNADPPSASPASAAGGFSASLPGYGVAAWLLADRLEPWQRRIEAFGQPYPAPDAADRAYAASIEDLRRLRFKPKPAERVFVRFTVPNLALAYEDSIWWDLFDNWNDLVLLRGEAEPEVLGFVSAHGFVERRPEKKDYIWPGVTTPWIALHDILLPGRHSLALRTIHHGEPFYSFVEAELTTNPSVPKEAWRIRFANELDLDRSRLSFDVELLAER